MKLTKRVKEGLLVLGIGIGVYVGILAGWHYRNETIIPFYYFIKDIVYTIIVRPMKPLINSFKHCLKVLSNA